MIIHIGECRIKIGFYFFAFLAIAAISDRSGALPDCLMAAFVHEGGHIALMLALPERRPREISVTPFGVRISGSPLAEFSGGGLAVLAAGSAANFVLTSVTFGWRPQLAAASLLLGAINLLPAENLDGGGILRLLLRKRLDEPVADRAARCVSWAVILVMSAAGMLLLAATGRNFSLIGMTAALAASIICKGKNPAGHFRTK